MFKKPVIWILFTLLSVAGVLFSFLHYQSVFPIVSIDLKMDRKSALESARAIAEKYNLGPNGFKQAASFNVDNSVKTYVESEHGGSTAFQKMIKGDFYSPYTWEVRHFKEGEVNETEIRFRPSGEPYGFSEWLSEDLPGASLSQIKAQAIAESEAKNSWSIDFTKYELIEKSQEIRAGGRIDHIFVYERPNIQIGAGQYRLSLEISGDKLTHLDQYINIPEEFYLSYEEMRSANNTIADVASDTMYLVYVLIGCCFGIFYLLRKRWVIWRTPLFWGAFVAFLQALTAINEWPADWMYYDTALSTHVFILEKVADLIGDFLFNVFLFTVSFMAAESLTRKAFPNHIQFWSLSSSGVANSFQVFGRTIGGYLLVGLDFAFLIGLYFFSTKALGWWTPSDALFDPNILATYFPWLSPIAGSFEAGFWEESLCRAVPIAGAALIGQRFGHRRAWIVGAVLFQAVLFGALHANYAGQPSYARIVELIIPSIVYGIIYIRFGLLTCIIVHFVYDAVLMAIPLFVSSASGIWIDKIIVVIFVCLPLGIIIYRRLRRAKWCELKECYFNKAWLPPLNKEHETSGIKSINTPVITPKIIRWVLTGGALGLILWVFTANFQDDAPPILINRDQAQVLAKKALNDRGIYLQDSWQVLSSVVIPGSQNDTFVWQKGGEETYRKLSGNYLDPPLWMVRFAKFEGDITDRAEQYYVYITNDGKLDSITHKLPESKSGATLSEDDAEKIALSAIESKYHLNSTSLKMVLAESTKRPSRRDWTFIFSDKENYPLDRGDARIEIEIAGNEVVATFRYVNIPENWSREYENKGTLIEIIDNLADNLMLGLTLVVLVGAAISWSRKQFSFHAFAVTFAILFSISFIRLTNEWPYIWSEFSTAEPILNQILTEISSSLFTLILFPIAFSLFVGLGQSWKRPQPKISSVKALLIGASLGAMLMGLSSFFEHIIPPLSPVWADYSAVDSYSPILEGSLGPLEFFIGKTIVLLLLFFSVDKFTKGWTHRKILISGSIIIFWLGSTAVLNDNITLWLISGPIIGLVLLFFYIFVFRFHLAIIPLFTAAIVIFGVVQESFYNAYPTAAINGILAIAIICIFSYFWFRKLATVHRANIKVPKKLRVRSIQFKWGNNIEGAEKNERNTA